MTSSRAGRSLRRSLRLLLFVLAASIPAGCAAASDLRDFTSDGCSLFPDGNRADRTLWCECCLDHDIAYWQGGTAAERKEADRKLRDCVQERTGNKVLAKLMYDGVRAGGHPAFPTWYRWAYGWEYGRNYQSLTDEERQQAADMLEAYRQLHPAGYCTKK